MDLKTNLSVCALKSTGSAYGSPCSACESRFHRKCGILDYYRLLTSTGGHFSVLCSSAGNNANSSAVCSHGRVWGIFLEILTSKHCQFVGFSCPGLRDFRQDFLHGNCFRSCDDDISTCGIMGQAGKARGALYLVTRPTSPYCGELQSALNINQLK
jgi:hypothetical protein